MISLRCVCEAARSARSVLMMLNTRKNVVQSVLRSLLELNLPVEVAEGSNGTYFESSLRKVLEARSRPCRKTALPKHNINTRKPYTAWP